MTVLAVISYLPREKGHLVNIVQHFCTFTEFQWQSIATASPWCEAVLYSPDPPFLFGVGSGCETILEVDSSYSLLAQRDCQFVKGSTELFSMTGSIQS